MFGEVFLCQFPFTSGAASKVRPALVLFDLGPDALICRVTSVQRNGPLEVALTDWRAAGLLGPSVARLDRLVTAEPSVVFLRRLGALGAADQLAGSHGLERSHAPLNRQRPNNALQRTESDGRLFPGFHA